MAIGVKQSLYLTLEMFEEIKAEATRLDRSISWVVNQAWKLAHKKITEIPSSDPQESKP